MDQSDKRSWAAIIRSVKSPIGLFALVVLSVEAILAGVVTGLKTQIDTATVRVIVYLMAGLLAAVVISVLIIALRQPAKTPVQPASKTDTPNKPAQDPAFANPSDYEILQRKMKGFADRYRPARITLAKGEQIIRKADVATEMFLLEDGNLIVDDETGRPFEEKELKYPGSIVGETAAIGPDKRRTASVYVYSSEATLVKITRQAILDLGAYDKDFARALRYLYKLHASRLEKVALYCGQGVKTKTEQCTVLMGDIHGYSRLSEKITDEMACPFHFKFTDQSSDAAKDRGGLFEDQGDGYKVIFRGDDNVNRALMCALDIQKRYASLIQDFAKNDDLFARAGLGMGICTDDFTVITKPDGTERILGHCINIAAALSKLYQSSNESKIYFTKELTSKLNTSHWKFSGPLVPSLDKLETKQEVFILENQALSPSPTS